MNKKRKRNSEPGLKYRLKTLRMMKEIQEECSKIKLPKDFDVVKFIKSMR